MKLIVAGSTGFVATELIRQALSHPAVTSIIALGRREAPTPANAGPNAAKFQSVICDNFENYSESVRQKLAGADACVWFVLSFFYFTISFFVYRKHLLTCL